MKKTIKAILTLSILTVLAMPRGMFAATVETPPVPTMLWPENQTSTILVKPEIRGLTKNDTLVEVYIDNQLNGKATVKNGTKDTASFSYLPFFALKPGAHYITVKAVDKTNTALKSKMSAVSNFMVEEALPAPTLFQPVVNDKTVSTKPFIVGVAVSDSLVKIFIDGKLNGQVRIENDPSGIGDFAYQPFLDLKPNEDHAVYATAIDSKGKQSALSNLVGFSVKAPVVQIAASNPEILGVTDNQNTVNGVDDTNNNAVIAPITEGTVEATQDNANSDDSKKAETTTDDKSSLIWWVVLAIAVVIIVTNLRNRGNKEEKGGLKGLADLTNKQKEHSGMSNPDNKFRQEALFKKEGDHTTGSGDGKKMPPPPPSK